MTWIVQKRKQSILLPFFLLFSPIAAIINDAILSVGKKEVVSMPSKKKILLLTTGGTIASLPGG